MKTGWELQSYICRQQLKTMPQDSKYQKYLIGQLLQCVLSRNRDQDNAEKKMVLAEDLGSEWKLTGATVSKYGFFANAIDDIFGLSEDLARMILSDKVAVSHENVLELSRLRGEEIRAIAKTIETENLNKITLAFIRNEVKLCHIQERGMIYDDLEYVEEADIFANQMKNVKALQPCEIFKANCEAGNDKALIIKSLVESYDLKINPGATPGTIAAISTFSSNILNGVARLIMAYGDKLKDEVFKEKVGNMPIKELTRTAKERRAGALGYAEAMLIAYNKRNKAPLIWQSLYSGSGKVIQLEKQDENMEGKRNRKKNCAN